MAETPGIMTANEHIAAVYREVAKHLSVRPRFYHVGRSSTSGTIKRKLREHRVKRLWYISRLPRLSDESWVELRNLGNIDRRYIFFVSRSYPLEAIGEGMHAAGADNPTKVLFKPESEEVPLLRRLLSILPAGQKEAILDAFWVGDTLEVINPSLARLRIPVEKLAGLRGKTRERLHRFEIDESGSYIHWPDPDVYYDWEHLTWALDPSLELRTPGRSREFYKRYGTAVRRLREAHGLNQGDIHGLGERQVRRIEEGESRLMVNSLRKLAAAHGLSQADYVSELNKAWQPD